MKYLSALTIVFAAATGAVWASCTSPAGEAGQFTYATNMNTMVFCDGTNWVSMSGGTNVSVGGTVNNPAGNDYELQFKSGTGFGSSSGLTWNNATSTLAATNIAGTLSTAAQPNITSIGTLTGLTVNGTISTTALYVNGVAITGSASGDRITSGTSTVQANQSTGYISLTTGATTWGYLGSSATYLPTLNAATVSASSVSVSTASFNGQAITTLAGGGGNYIVSGSTQVSTSSAGSITFVTANSQRMVIDSSGKVGIGTATPAQRLSVYGGIAAYYDPTNYAAMYGGISHSGNGGGLTLTSQGANNTMNGSGDIMFVTSDANSANGDIAASTSEKMRIKYNGNVGIGTSSSLYKFHLNGQSDSPSLSAVGGIAAFDTNSSVELTMGGYLGAPYGFWLQTKNNQLSGLGTGTAYPLLLNPLGGNIGIGTNAPGTTLHLARTSGEVALRMTNPNSNYWDIWNAAGNSSLYFNYNNVSKFNINSDGSANLAGALTQNSDARLKTDIKPIPTALEKLALINGVTFHWKDKSRDQKEQMGVIAQDVQKAFPQLVHADASGTLSVNYPGMVAPLIEAVKTLKTENEALRAQLKAMNARLEKLEAQQK